jgi:atypical dual specificity phosphatase
MLPSPSSPDTLWGSMAPKGFDWLLPNQLAGCASPAYGEVVIAALRASQIHFLINLHEQPDPPDLLAALGARTLHLPVMDFTPPTQEQLEIGVAAIAEALAKGTPVAVHCGAGLGRTGTLLAAYLVFTGIEPDVAMNQVRAARPGSVETPEQEQAVRRFAQRLR